MRQMRRDRGNRSNEKKIGRHGGPEGFASKFEQRIFHEAKKRGLQIRYEPTSFLFNRRVRGANCGDCGSREVTKQAKYTPDFGLSGVIFVESKGKFDASSRARHDEFRKDRPDVCLRFLFAYNNWTTKKHLQRYSDWCGERGIEYAIGDKIPQEWAEEAEHKREGGASSPPPALYEPSLRDRTDRRNRKPSVQRRKRNKVPVESGSQE